MKDEVIGGMSRVAAEVSEPSYGSLLFVVMLLTQSTRKKLVGGYWQ